VAAIAAQQTLRPKVGGREAVVQPVVLEMIRSRLIAAPARVFDHAGRSGGPLALSGSSQTIGPDSRASGKIDGSSGLRV